MRIAIAAGAALLLWAIRPKRRRKRGSSAWKDSGAINGYRYKTVRTPGTQPGDKAPVLLLFHGMGDDPERMVAEVLPTLKRPAHVVVPEGKNSGPKWWVARAGDDDQAALSEQMQWVADDFRPFLERINKRFGPPVVAGHSQGAMMASLLALRFPSLVARGAVASAWVPEPLQRSDGAPLVLVHGEDDKIVPFSRSSAWAKAASAAGAKISFEPVEGGHQLQGALARSWVDAINAALGK